jgi:hypothetical protein
LVSTTDWVELAPTATDPNETLAGLAVTGSLVTPVPPSSIWRSGFEAVLVNVAFPPVHPIAGGVKVTLRATLSPAETTIGRLKGDALNSVEVMLIAESVMLVCPLFVKVTSWVSVWPTGTVPKCRLAGVHVNCCVAARALKETIVTNRVRVITENTGIEVEFDRGSRMHFILSSFNRSR